METFLDVDISMYGAAILFTNPSSSNYWIFERRTRFIFFLKVFEAICLRVFFGFFWCFTTYRGFRKMASKGRQPFSFPFPNSGSTAATLFVVTSRDQRRKGNNSDCEPQSFCGFDPGEIDGDNVTVVGFSLPPFLSLPRFLFPVCVCLCGRKPKCIFI